MNTRRFTKYAAFAAIARREVQRAPADKYGRVVFFGVILGVFTALWRAIADAGMPVNTEPERLVWYLAITEWIVLSVPHLHVEIESDIRRGDVAYRLPRPVSYVASLLAEGAGQLSVRLPLLGIAGFGFAWLLTGRVPNGSLTVLWVIPLVVLSTLVLSAIYVVIGLLAFWLGETAPVYWLVQKLMFVLGGLMLPLELYPPFVIAVADFTPFPSLLYGPAALILGTSTRSVGSVAAAQAFWLLAAVAAGGLLFHRARKSLELNGG